MEELEQELYLCLKCGLQKTGRPASEWFAFAISILSIANVFAIITGALLKKLGEVKPN